MDRENDSKQMFERKFVNLVDLVDTGNTGACAFSRQRQVEV